MTLLPQTNPILPPSDPEMHDMQLSHSHQICGIVAHVKDRGVASVALRSLAIAAECLIARHEQEEVLQIFDKIEKETGWRIGFLHKELKEKWGWVDEEAMAQQLLAHQNSLNQFFQNGQTGNGGGGGGGNVLPSAPPVPRQTPPGGILNPMLKTADFSLPNHPYQQYYQPPNQQAQFSHNYL